MTKASRPRLMRRVEDLLKHRFDEFGGLRIGESDRSSQRLCEIGPRDRARRIKLACIFGIDLWTIGAFRRMRVLKMICHGEARVSSE